MGGGGLARAVDPLYTTQLFLFQQNIQILQRAGAVQMEDGGVQIVQFRLQFLLGQIPEHRRRDQGAEVAAGHILAAGMPHAHPVGGAFLVPLGDVAQLAEQHLELLEQIH